MAEKVIVDVEARFHDSMSPSIDRAIAKAEKLEKAAAKVAKVLDKLDSLNKKSSFEIKDKASAVLEKIAEKMKKLIGQKKWDFLVSLKDKASAKLDKIAAKLKGVLSQKQWDFLVGLKDKASAGLQKIANKLRSINKEKLTIRINVAQNVFQRVAEISAKLKALSKNAWDVIIGLKDRASKGLSKIRGIAKALVAAPYKITVSLLDKVTAPLRKIKGLLGSVAGLVGIGLGAAGVAQTVGMYADREDLTAQFKVLLGSQEAATKRLQELTTFAGQTPFTRDEIFQASRVLETYTEGALATPDAPGGLRMIGDIAAATGAEYTSVATYMARMYNEIKRGGEALGEPLMYLREMGAVSAEAEKKIMEIAAGSGTVEEKWKAIANEFSRFDGMMLEMSNQMNNLLLGVKSFLTNNFLMKIGEGITSQLKPFLIDFRAWRNENGDLIASWAASTKEFAALLSGKVLGTIRAIASNSFELFSSDKFKSANLIGKIGMIWDDVIVGPLSDWWSGRGKGMFESKARSMGETLGEGITKGLTALFSGGANGISGVLGAIFDVGGTFIQGFLKNFDGNKILSALRGFVDKIPDTFSKLKDLWHEYIGAPFSAWWQSGGKALFVEFASNIGDWLGTGITKGVQFLSDGILSILGLKDSNGIAGEIGDIGKSFWDSFTASFDGSAITKAIVDAISGVWSALPLWAKLLVGGYGISKAATALGPLVNVMGGIGNAGRGVMAGFGNTARGVGTVGTGLGQGASMSYYVGSGLFNVGSKAYTLLGGTALTGSTAALAGLGAVGGGIATGIGLYDAGTDLYSAYKAHKSGDKATRDYNVTTGVHKLGGMGVGAAAGFALGGPVGALIGAGLGYIGGKFIGDKMARSAEAANYESKEMQEAIKDSSKSAEELAYEFEKAKEQNLADHFGDISLSLEEIQDIAKNIAFGDKAEELETFASAAKTAETSFKNLKSVSIDLERWNWKASLGYKFDESSKEQLLASVDNFISGAKQYVEDKHYELTCAIDLLLEDGETKDGMIEKANAYYAGIQEQLNTAGENLKAAYTVALENDGVITADEAATIAEAQAEVNRILQKISNAENKAELQKIQIKFSGLDVESFESLQTELGNYIESASTTYDDALTATLTNLNLQLEDGAISQEEYDAQVQAAVDGYNANIDQLNADVAGVQLNFLADAFSEELGADAVGKLQGLLNDCLANNEDPVEMTLTDIKAKLGEDVTLSEEDAANLTEKLSTVMSQMQSKDPVEIETTVKPNVSIDEETDVSDEVSSAVEGSLQETITPVEPTVTVNPTFELGDSSTFTVPDNSLDTSTNTTVTVNSEYTRSPEEMTIPDGELDTTTSATVGVNVTYYTSSSNLAAYKASLASFSGSTGQSAGGKSGGKSGGRKTARGNEIHNATGGIVNGMKLTWVGEEGPEAIIPLVKSRRKRGLELWAEAGRRMGVLENANGGIYGGSSDEEVSGNSMRSFVGGGSSSSGESSQKVSTSSSDQNSVDVNIGGVTIQVNANGDSGNLLEMIRAQKDDISEEVAGVILNALKPLFANIPERG